MEARSTPPQRRRSSRKKEAAIAIQSAQCRRQARYQIPTGVQKDSSYLVQFCHANLKKFQVQSLDVPIDLDLEEGVSGY